MKAKFILLLTVFFLAITAQSQIRYLKATLQGSQEVPPNASTAAGVVIIRYNTATKALQLWGNYQNLSAAVTGSHIHSPGPAGSNGPVILGLNNTGGTTGSLNGSTTLTVAQEGDLFAGNMYVNVHSGTFTGGEIRGQISNTTNGQTEFFNGRLQGAQENPPNASAATGTFNLLLDKTTDSVFLTGNFAGLTTPASAAHIHAGAPNVNGSVKINVAFSAATSGTIHVASPILAADETEMIIGNTYVNIHNATFPGGEIRGQINQFSQMQFLRATLQGSQEVPPNASAARGTVLVRYNTATRLLELGGDYQNLTTAVTASHVHSPAAPGSNASVLFTVTNTGGTSGNLTASATLTPGQEVDLLNGNMYVNVHNSTFPGGEIRGQLGVTSSGETQVFAEILQGAQEVPSNASTATGAVSVFLDKLTNQVYLTGSFSGLAANASAAHIHSGAAGVNGPVVVTLNATAATAGTINISTTVTPAFAAEMINGNTYVNIHNASFPGGELRAQLANLTLPVKLSYFNGFKNGSGVTLVWESAEEINLDRYEIEQQSENGQWLKRAEVVARGVGAATKYSINNVPLTGRSNYVTYRIKMLDKDGKITYSPVIKINFSRLRMELFIRTNPVLNKQLRFSVSGLSSDKKAQVSVIDYSGRTLIKTTTSLIGDNFLSTANLAKGMYKLIVRIDDEVLQQSFSNQ